MLHHALVAFGLARKRSCFIAGQSWSVPFTRYTALALKRECVRVELDSMTIGYL